MRLAHIALAWVLPATLALLQGCASLLPPATTTETEIPEVWRGRFALTVAATPQAAEQRSTGRFVLTAAKAYTELELVSPLGNTLASARSDSSGALLKTADGKTFSAASPEALTEQVFGWRVPVDRLPAWLRGEVEQVQERAADGNGTTRTAEGIDHGWSVRFEQWGARQPQRLTASFPQRAVLRLVVDDF